MLKPEQIGDLMSKAKETCKSINDSQLNTRSRTTSIYGCNMKGVHEVISEPGLDADKNMGKQLVIPNGRKILPIWGFKIGGLVLANINKDPESKKNSKGKIIKRYKKNNIGPLVIELDCRVTDLVITNRADLIVKIKSIPSGLFCLTY